MNYENVGTPLAVVVKSTPETSTKKQRIPILSLDGKKEARTPVSSIHLDETEKFQPIPNPEVERQIIYITGASGSGKSVFSKNYCKEYRKIFPSRPIYIFSSVGEDTSVDDIPDLHRIRLDADFMREDFEIDDFKDSLVLFDDTECISDKKLNAKVVGILNIILETGRHTNTSCLYTSHIACGGNQTKKILNEAHSVVFFPLTLGGRSLKYLLESYYGLDKAQIKKIKKLESRWVMFSKTYPRVVMAERDAYLITHDDDA